MKKPININNKDYYFIVTSYRENGRLAIQLTDKDDSLYSDVTINLSDLFVSDIDEAFINDDFNVCSREIYKYLKSKGIIQESFGIFPYNYGKYEYVKFNLEKLKEYDPIGVDELLSNIKDYSI